MRDSQIQLITCALNYGCNHKFGDGDMSNLFRDALDAWELESAKMLLNNQKIRNYKVKTK